MQVHWRDRRVVTDPASLTAQVARWQKNTGLDWSSEEIQDVARYLNATVYRFPDLAPRAQRMMRGRRRRLSEVQMVSGTILMAPHGHSDTQMPQPLQ